MDINTVLYAIIILMLFYVGYVSTRVLAKQSNLIKDTGEVHQMFKNNFDVVKELYNPEVAKNVLKMHKDEIVLKHKKELEEIRKSKVEKSEIIKIYDEKLSKYINEIEEKTYANNYLISIVTYFMSLFPDHFKEISDILFRDPNDKLLKQLTEINKRTILRGKILMKKSENY